MREQEELDVCRNPANDNDYKLGAIQFKNPVKDKPKINLIDVFAEDFVNILKTGVALNVNQLKYVLVGWLSVNEAELVKKN